MPTHLLPILLALPAALQPTPAPPPEPPNPAQAPSTALPFTLITHDLAARPIKLVSWSAEGLRYIDDTGADRVASPGTIAALAPEGWVPTAATPAAAAREHALRRGWSGVVDLTDGQRLVGRPMVEPDAQAADHLSWNHPRLGPIQIPLDRVARVRTGVGTGAPIAADPGGDDLVVLVNGDLVRGLVEDIDASVTITTGPISPGAAGTRIEVLTDRVREILLTNPPAAPAGTVLWFNDGTAVAAVAVDPRLRGVDAHSLAVSPQRDLGSREGVWRLDELEAVTFDAARVRGLASIPPARHDRAPGSDRRLVDPPRTLGSSPAIAPLWAADIELPGPMLVEWTLPARATRLAGWAELPPENWAWGDCELIITSGTRELYRARIHAGAPLARIDVPLPASTSPTTIRVTLDPGEHGPIQDRIILRRPLIAVGP